MTNVEEARQQKRRQQNRVNQRNRRMKLRGERLREDMTQVTYESLPTEPESENLNTYGLRTRDVPPVSPGDKVSEVQDCSMQDSHPQTTEEGQQQVVPLTNTTAWTTPDRYGKEYKSPYGSLRRRGRPRGRSSGRAQRRPTNRPQGRHESDTVHLLMNTHVAVRAHTTAPDSSRGASEQTPPPISGTPPRVIMLGRAESTTDQDGEEDIVEALAFLSSPTADMLLSPQEQRIRNMETRRPMALIQSSPSPAQSAQINVFENGRASQTTSQHQQHELQQLVPEIRPNSPVDTDQRWKDPLEAVELHFGSLRDILQEVQMEVKAMRIECETYRSENTKLKADLERLTVAYKQLEENEICKDARILELEGSTKDMYTVVEELKNEKTQLEVTVQEQREKQQERLNAIRRATLQLTEDEV